MVVKKEIPYIYILGTTDAKVPDTGVGILPRSWIIWSAKERFEWKFEEVIFKLILVTDGSSTSCEISLRWILLELAYDKSLFYQKFFTCTE